MFMDDIISAAESLNSAFELQNGSIEILSSGIMLLHKCCNDASQLCQTNDKIYPLGNLKETKALGILRKSKMIVKFKC